MLLENSPAPLTSPQVVINSAARFEVAVINRSSIISDVEAARVVSALQRQTSEHFAPVWGVDAHLTFVGSQQDAPADAWWLLILDDSDQAGDLGYHDLTDQGLPLGKIFAKTDQTYKSQWSVTASHELLEMLADPYINLAAMQYPGNNNTYMSLYAYEVCDPCEADRYGYEIDGVLVSDFVFPSWFENSLPPYARQYDYLQRISRPLDLLPGGYISVYDVQFGAGWSQLMGPATSRSYASRAQIGSRRERRRIPRNAWECSRPQNTAARELPRPSTTTVSATVQDSHRRQRYAAAQTIALIGQQRQTLRGQVATRRESRYQAFLEQIPNRTEPLRSGSRAATPSGAKQPLRILAEGDSWFEYPLPPSYGVISELETLLNIPIANMAQAGEEVRQMLGLEVRQEIIKRLTDHGNVRFDALLFSGGGNDLVGDALAILLANGPSVVAPDQMLNSDALSASLALLAAEYRELIAIRDRYSPGTAIFVNCYDFPPITGIPVCGHGPWLKPSLDYAYSQAGVTNADPNVEFLIVRELLARFRAKLVEIANDPNVRDFYVVETQQTLDANNNDWANELHPSPAGFRKIAQKFRQALGVVFP